MNTSDERIKRLMNNVGMPNSLSLYQAFKQLENELSQDAIKHVPPPEDEKGPFFAQNGSYIASADFRYDVALVLTGDFGTSEEKEAYAKWVADALNAQVVRKPW